jgi:hypothetical protein
MKIAMRFYLGRYLYK